MTKRKAIMYLIILAILVTAAQIWKTNYLSDPASKLPDPCKMVISGQCQQYINKITAEKKYEETVSIQKIRIRENEQLLKFFKKKIQDKCLFEMTAQEADESLQACIGTPKGKRDYFLLKTADFTIRDILVDSLAVSQMQYSELHDKKAAEKTLKHAKKIIKNNKYFEKRADAFKIIEKELSELK